MRRFRPGRDPRAVRHAAAGGHARAAGQHVVVVGGGIAGISAALILAERGVRVSLLEREATWGGRVRSWDLPDGRSMSRGFHAFFGQYYTLRSILRRADPGLANLISIGDYPLQLADGPRDSFRGIPRTPPWSVAAFALRSRSFPARQLARVDVRAALSLLQTDFPQTFAEYAGESAQDFLDRLRFPHDARHLALEVFARSFFADPGDFSAAELVGMFHTYFMGSAEGLVFDVPTDAYSAILWDPLVDRLRGLGVTAETGVTVTGISSGPDGVRVETADRSLAADAVVLAADPRAARDLLTAVPATGSAWAGWVRTVGSQRNAPPFAVWRLWLDRPAGAQVPAFIGTSGFGPLDNVAVLDRFEATAQAWREAHGGSVIELHAYAVAGAALTGGGGRAAGSDGLAEELHRQLGRLYPDLAAAGVRHEEWLVADDCPLIGTGPWAERPTVATPDPRIVLAGDWLRTDEPVALMERAALTGVHAANRLLADWGVAGEDWWSVPLTGVLHRPVRRARAARGRFAAGAAR
ncbi:MAG: FAD-dependent oxidoreductase [Propionibacteriaceae bacterium]|nr:FAD-dependent oxidoreductase [Propionibacteriaceae bacterium]